MLDEIIFNVIESNEGGFEAKAIGHSIYTECDSYDDLKETLREAVFCHFDEKEMPKLIRIHLVKDEVYAI